MEYYTRLEQARTSRPSRRVLAGIAMALRLNDTEIIHLHHFAGQPPRHTAVAPHVPRTDVLDWATDCPEPPSCWTPLPRRRGPQVTGPPHRLTPPVLGPWLSRRARGGGLQHRVLHAPADHMGRSG
ncbi:hypothetical protein [Streptomyces olivochromogenes]|uniref:hypothetical protein n=1 Tax=Streptomyces olivochromogenes TaxID=1963 RepID=UPI0036A8FA03